MVTTRVFTAFWCNIVAWVGEFSIAPYESAILACTSACTITGSNPVLLTVPPALDVEIIQLGVASIVLASKRY